MLSLLGVSEDHFFTKVVLPIGISFHTFQSMSYTIDAYNGVIQTERSFVRFLTFVSFFPQLVAGPIERAHNLLPQLQQTPRITRQDLTVGLSLFLVGFFKKVALADYLAQYVDPVYGNPGLFQAPALILATAGVRLANLLRLQRLYRHGPRHRPPDGLPDDAQLQQPVCGHGPG